MKRKNFIDYDNVIKRIMFTLVMTILSLSTVSVIAQNNKPEKKQSMTSEYLAQLVKEGKSDDIVITAEHISSLSGTHHIYLLQAINGIGINGTESSVHIDASGKVIKVNNAFIDRPKLITQTTTAALSARDAILSVAQKMNYSISNLQEVNRKGGVNQEVTFNTGGISRINIPVKLIYQLTENNTIQLSWELSIDDVNSPEDWWNFRVDANTGEILSKNNFIAQCYLEHSHSHEAFIGPINKSEEATVSEENSTALIGTYNVFAIPVESPNHGARTSIVDPHLDGTGSPFGWHDTNGSAGAEFTDTRGNNIDAFGFNTGNRANGGGSLNFNFTLDLNAGALTQENAALTNMFYMGNIMHDVTYEYGFTEAAGNFQENNYGNGGAGSDYVVGEGQKTGQCNAFFGTPADGGNPTMQMFICVYGGATGDRDGDFDNGVIAHEYGHGISNRLTGGPGTTGCLGNQEQMGEGWSDYFGLVLTIEPGDAGTDPRGMGTWLAGQVSTGAGIRSQRYDTDTNTYTYDSIKTEVAPHGVGSVWAMMLWEMTWDLIDEYGFDPDVYNGTGGNNIALALVMEGLKLQPCNPGFVDGRDAILQADLNLYGGANQCLIWTAFAGRGLGFSANQGSTGSKNDGTQAFDLPPGSAVFVADIDTVCITNGVQNGVGGGAPVGGTYSGTGVTDDGNGTSYTFDPTVAGVGTANVVYTVFDTCSGATANLNQTIEVTDGIPILVCNDITVTLDGAGNASIVNSDVANTAPDTTQYTVDQTGTFSPIDISGSATSVSLIEDGPSGLLPLGFTFSFFGNDFTNFYLQSNGFLSFDNSGTTGSASWTPVAIPNTGGPNNMIAYFWDDMSPQLGGTVQYATIGTAPNRILVVDYINIRQYNINGTGNQITTQVQLYEGSSHIEVHTTSAPNGGGLNRTQGVENANGTAGFFVPGRNGVPFALTNDVVRFIPLITEALADNCGSPVTLTLSQSNFTCRDIGVNTVTVTADDGIGGMATCDAMVTVIGETTIYTGSWDNGNPDAGKKAVFSTSYNTSIADIDACSCEINNNATVTVGADDYMSIDGNITVDAGSSLIVEHTGNVVQIDDAALVTNNGTINVQLTTPALNARDFMIMGSPMTADDENVFTDGLPAYQVLFHTTANFDPYVGTPPVVGVNFHDQDSNDWANFSGTLNAGEGYLIRPSFANSGSYNYVYNQGTLNNGEILYPAYFGDDKEDSPNVISNPYASAMDAALFISSNAMVDEVYFWEHLTTPAGGIPGPLNENFSMEDISTYNGTMGIPASNDPGTSTTPNGIISTGQGFGIKANAGGNVTFNNAMRLTSGNTTLRRPVEKDLLWIMVREGQYHMGSTTGIGFLENATAGLDQGYDTQKLGTVVSLYTHLLDGSEQLGIQGREAFNPDITIPMGFSTLIQADAGLPYVISISDLEGTLIEEATVYLIDHQENTVTNLSEANYTFLSDAGTFNNRFTIQFEGLVLGTVNNTLEDIALYPNPTQNMITIVSPGIMIAKAEVYDVRGRKVNEVSFANENDYHLDLSNLESAMYFVKISSENGSITKRIVKY
ncbi:M36 family metallopeptidase [Ulvibacter antarcticus]|uniref:Putative secreted protein (Por secretion system target) n=1 Tax=Ulvibacter antarcticus TaxID=442714 RepID=A0A3L9YBL3_9FLAO|nr:M36 family metallopeptidase [Ulvibacter antarcticus]RMA57764.1 putative secreted protein (Por secretion system target) [Ulvibacter antarcticus]